MSLDESSVKISSTQKWGCGLIVVNSDGEVLMGRRCKPDDLDQWSFAGGSVEIGETPIDAVVREALEEMSITIIPNKLKYVGSFELDGIQDFVFGTIKEQTYGIPSPYVKEFSELKWIDIEEFTSLNKEGKIFEASAKAAELLESYLRS